MGLKVDESVADLINKAPSFDSPQVNHAVNVVRLYASTRSCASLHTDQRGPHPVAASPKEAL